MVQSLSNLVINSSLGAYKISFQTIGVEQFTNSYFLVDQIMQEKLKLDVSKCFYISAKEVNKDLKCVEDVIVQLSARGMNRKNDLVVIGGGFLQDLGTLVSSLFMRGVPWKYVPTTLAAMGDSCIGGKSSINAGYVKNLIGNFYPPKMVLIDPSFVSTLPDLEIIAGFAEIIKICFAYSFQRFDEVTKMISSWYANRDIDCLSQIIQLSLLSKKHFIERDEFDTGIRNLLNFGHSFGHALEAASNYRIPHGVAVLIGMIAASNHPQSKKSRESELLIKTCLAFSKIIGQEISSEISKVDYSMFAQALSRDKKNSSTNLVLVLPVAIGLEVVEIPFKNKALDTATYAMKLAIEMVLNEIR